MNVSIVSGLGFGDEGKGMTTNYLCNRNPGNTIVVRYGGGNQVGHTVIGPDGKLHTHHHTGSGTLSGVPTFYSKFCTFDPIGVLREIDRIKDKYPELKIRIGYDPRAMVVTPFDHRAQIIHIPNLGHGTVGVGFGTTIQRNEDHYRLYAVDLLNPWILNEKIKSIQNYYAAKGVAVSDPIIDQWLVYCAEFIKEPGIEIKPFWNFNDVTEDNDIVFEGHQGILLDMEYGLFPHVTRSKTTCKNAYLFMEEEGIDAINAVQYLITRAYHTRHGNGPFLNGAILLKNNEAETNVSNQYQGVFKTAPLDIDLLKHAILCNIIDNGGRSPYQHIVITCLDQVAEPVETIKTIRESTKGYEFFISGIYTSYDSTSNLKSLA